jgi:hypothetical protein
VYETVFEACEAGEGAAVVQGDLRARAVRAGDPTMSRIAEVTTIEVEVDGRWDALALSEALIPFHSFLVHYDLERWVVHARVPGGHGGELPDALEAIEVWRAEQGTRPAACRVGGRPYQLPEQHDPHTDERRTSRYETDPATAMSTWPAQERSS